MKAFSKYSNRYWFQVHNVEYTSVSIHIMRISIDAV